MTQKKTCPQCGNKENDAYKPFCSQRCSQLDLGAWLSEGYRLPGSLEGRESEVDELIEGLEKEAQK